MNDSVFGGSRAPLRSAPRSEAHGGPGQRGRGHGAAGVGRHRGPGAARCRLQRAASRARVAEDLASGLSRESGAWVLLRQAIGSIGHNCFDYFTIQ